jgi:hypothetical protein
MKKIQKIEFQKTFENFVGNILKNNNYDNYENISKSNGLNGEVDQETKNNILNVENFNNWLANDWTGFGTGRGAPNLIGKSQNLSPYMIEKYFLDQGVECSETEINDFINKIKQKWNS